MTTTKIIVDMTRNKFALKPQKNKEMQPGMCARACTWQYGVV